MTQKLTALVPCKNERHNIRACIESFRTIADEILIADSGSTDGTLDIVRNLDGCRIIEREYVTSGDFKNWAIPQARHPWILLVDADERVRPELAEEIHGYLQRGPDRDGYWIRRNNYFLGYHVRHGSWGRDKVLRFFHRDRGRYEGPSDHGEVQISTGRVGWLRGRLDHYSYWSYEQYIQKLQRYTWLQARQWYEQGRRPSFVQLLFRAPLRFLREYVLLGGFLDGAVGLQIAALSAFYSFLKQARLWEEHYGRQRPEGEPNRPEWAPPTAASSQSESAAAQTAMVLRGGFTQPQPAGSPPVGARHTAGCESQAF